MGDGGESGGGVELLLAVGLVQLHAERFGDLATAAMTVTDQLQPH